MNNDSVDRTYDSGFSAGEIAECIARRGLLAIAIELSPVLPRSSIADALLRFDGPEPAVLSLKEVYDVLRQAHELGARRVMLLSGPARGLLEPEVIAFAGELGMESETGPRNPGPTPDGCALRTSSTGQGCKRHNYSCVVSMHGQVYPCVGVPLPLGNVHDTPLRDILCQSEVIENLLSERKLVKEPCRDCRDAEDCYGCRGAAFSATGDYLAPDPTCPRVEGVAIDSLPVDVTPLIPHGATMQMIDRLTHVGERLAMAEFLVPDTCSFVDSEGRLDETVYVELIVQALAACQGFQMPASERSQHRGLLLGAKNLQITGEARVGDHLTIHVRKTARFGGFGVAEGIVYHRDGREVARGEAKVWQGDADPSGASG